MNTVLKPYTPAFRDEVVRAALAHITKDLGVREMTLINWMRQADIDEGNRSGISGAGSKELC